MSVDLSSYPALRRLLEPGDRRLNCGRCPFIRVGGPLTGPAMYAYCQLLNNQRLAEGDVAACTEADWRGRAGEELERLATDLAEQAVQAYCDDQDDRDMIPDNEDLPDG